MVSANLLARPRLENERVCVMACVLFVVRIAVPPDMFAERSEPFSASCGLY